MVRTTIYLPEPVKRELELQARRERRSEADIIRDALDQRLASRRAHRPWRAVFSSGHRDTSERVDEVLAEGFGR